MWCVMSLTPGKRLAWSQTQGKGPSMLQTEGCLQRRLLAKKSGQRFLMEVIIVPSGSTSCLVQRNVYKMEPAAELHTDGGKQRRLLQRGTDKRCILSTRIDHLPRAESHSEDI